MATAFVRTFTRAELRAIQSIPETCQCAATKTGGKPCSFRPSCQVLFRNSSEPSPSSASASTYASASSASASNASASPDSKWMCARHARMTVSSASSAAATAAATAASTANGSTAETRNNDSSSSSSHPCCSICLDSLVTKTTGAWKRNVRVTTCKHAFHTACIRRWLAKTTVNPHTTCPVCRHPVVSLSAAGTATNPRNPGDASASARNASARNVTNASDTSEQSDSPDWYDRMVDLMRANLEPDQVSYVLEVSTIYNLTFFPLTPQAYRGGQWMPAILRDW